MPRVSSGCYLIDVKCCSVDVTNFYTPKWLDRDVDARRLSFSKIADGPTLFVVLAHDDALENGPNIQ